MISCCLARRVGLAVIAACAFCGARAIAMDEPHNYYAQWSNGPSSSADVFPIAVWLQSPGNAAAYEQVGVNLFVGLWEGPTEAQLSTLQSAGMPVICDQNDTGLSSANAPLIRSWSHNDEPDNAQPDGSGGWGPPVEPSVVIAQYNAFRTADPTRPVYLNLGQGVAWDGWYGRGVRTDHPEDYYEYVQGCDIASYDIYPVNAAHPDVSGNLWYVALGVERLRTYVGDAKPVWCWIECTQIDVDSAAKPTPAQVRTEVWMAITHGANGIGYFCHSWFGGFVEAALLGDAEMAAAVSQINAQVQSLASVLNSPTVAGAASVASSNAGVPIDILVKQQDGATYVFSVAMRDDATTGTFTLSEAATVEVLGEGRQIDASSGSFTDAFAGYGVHIYRCAPTGGVEPADQLPVVSFTSPTDAEVSGVVAANAVAHDPDEGITDGAGIESVRFDLLRGNQVLVTLVENLAPYDWTLDTAAFADGTCVLRATATSTPAAGGGSVDARAIVGFSNGLSADRDTDDDLLPDWWEVQNGLDPANPDSDGDGTPDAEEDTDGDSISNLGELVYEEAGTAGDGVSCAAGRGGSPGALSFALMGIAFAFRCRRLHRQRLDSKGVAARAR